MADVKARYGKAYRDMIAHVRDVLGDRCVGERSRIVVLALIAAPCLTEMTVLDTVL